MAEMQISDSGSPAVHFFGEVDSTFATGFALAKEGRLPVFGSVVAKSQTAGRGQAGRHWISPPGNLYASIRLPVEEPFSGQAGAIAFGSLCAAILKDLGCQAALKWPNDLVSLKNGRAEKVGGILLMERDSCLLAGIGINLKFAPRPEETSSAALPAGVLTCSGEPGPSALWLSLAKALQTGIEAGPGANADWRELANELLIWRDREVALSDGSEQSKGILKGIGNGGGAVLIQDGEPHEYFSGSLTLA